METISAKTIVTNKAGGDNWFGENYNMNIYKGCCHGCIYCDSRSECYHVENFDTVRAKENALLTIRNDLQRKVRGGIVGTGSMSDPYNPFEREQELTRHALELINAYGFGVSIATKSPLIVRDIDILTEIKEHSPVLAKITVTAAEDSLCRKIEPNVAPSSERFEAIGALSEAGIFCGILMTPVLPFLEDNEENILAIIQKAHENGARFIYPAFGVTLRQNQRDYFFERLDEGFPGVKEKYLRQFGNAYQCVSPDAKRLWGVFKAACDRLGILYTMKDIVRAARLGYGDRQLTFF